MTGLGLIESLRSARSDLPVILCSGYSEIVDEARAIEAGAAGYIRKPIDEAELTEAVAQVFAARSPAVAVAE
jgi:CheY-like chemotaxis protein